MSGLCCRYKTELDHILIYHMTIDIINSTKIMNPNQLLQEYLTTPSIELEVQLVVAWLAGKYNSDINIYQQVTQLLNSIIYLNIRVAIKVLLSCRHSNSSPWSSPLVSPNRFYNYEWSTSQNHLYWLKVRSMIFDHLDIDDLRLIDYSQYQDITGSQALRLVEQLDQPRQVIKEATRNIMIRQANNYLALIKGIECRATIKLAAMIRAEDIGNPHLDRIYHAYILEHMYYNDNHRTVGLTGEVVLEQLRDNLSPSKIKRYGIGNTYPHIIENQDEVAIKEFISIMATHGFNTIMLSNTRSIYRMASSAAATVLGLDVDKVLHKTEKLTTYNQLIGDRMVKNPLNWNRLDVINDEEYVKEMIDNLISSHRYQSLIKILHHPKWAYLIPCVKLFQSDQELAILIAQLGGRLSLRDLDVKREGMFFSPRKQSIINVQTIQFVINNGYQLTAEDADYVKELVDNKMITDPIGLQLLAGMGVEVPAYQVRMQAVVDIESINRMIDLKPEGTRMDSWISTIRTIDKYLVNSKTDIIAIRLYSRGINESKKVIRYYQAIREYVDTVNNQELTKMIDDWKDEEEKRLAKMINGERVDDIGMGSYCPPVQRGQRALV